MWGILLYLFSYLGVFAYSLRFTMKNRIRYMWVYAYLFTALYVYLSTELLSLFNCLNRAGVLVAWLLFLVGLSVLCIKDSLWQSWSDFLRHHPVRVLWKGFLRNKFLFLALFWFLLITFLGAILYAPNTYDAMTYHMTRIMHWLQNENVSHIITNDQRLNYQLPWAEYMIMHIQLLLTKDYFANLIQWNAYVSSIITVSLIAAELRLSRNVQLLASFVMALVPNVIFQAQSTQNDLVVGSFLLLFVLFMLKLCRVISFKGILLAGLSMGLALSAKGTAFLYIGILGPAFAVWILWNSGRYWFRNALKCSVIVVTGLVLLFPIFYRNYFTYHTILPANPDKNSNSVYIISDLAPLELMRTFMRNMSLHLGMPNAKWNSALQRGLEQVFGPKYLITQNTNAARIPPRVSFALYEDEIGNFLHILLFFFFCLIILIMLMYQKFRKQKWLQKEPVCFSIVSFLTMLFIFIALCYSPWRARYHVPLFCLFSVCIAYGIHLSLRVQLFRWIFYILLLCNGLYFLHNNSSHPIDWLHLKSLTYEKLKRQKNEHLPDRKTFDRLNHFKKFLEEHEIKEILFHNTANQRDYPILKFLGTPIQRNGISVKRIDCQREDLKKYKIPYLLLVSWDTTFDRFPRVNYEILYAHNGMYLFDLRKKVDNTIVLPVDSSFEKYNSKFFFERAYDLSNYSWVGPKSPLKFSLREKAEHDILLSLKAHTTPVPGKYRYRFFYKGKLLKDFLVPGGVYFLFQLVLPRDLLKENQEIQLDFVAENIISPAKANISRDPRPIALRPMTIMLCYLDEDKHPILPIEKPKQKINLVQDLQSYRLIDGFSSLESSGVWTSQRNAILQIPVPPGMQGKTLFCKIQGYAFLHPDKKKRQIVKIQSRNQLLGQKIFLFPDAASPIYITLPSSMTKRDTIFLNFVLPDAESPKSLGLSSDTRVLAYHLISLQVKDKQNELFFPSEKTISSDSSEIIFSNKKNSNFILGEGFSSLEASGVWTAAENCYFKIGIPDSFLQKTMNVKMEFGTFLDQEFSLYWGNNKLGSWKFQKAKTLEKICFTVPAGLNTEKTPVLSLKIKNPKSPAAYKMSCDQRRLGVFLRRIQLTFP